MKTFSYSLQSPNKNEVVKWFRVSAKRASQKLFNDFIRKTEKDLLRWETKVVDALSDPLPRYLWHRRRPYPNRKFPYMNEGELRDSVFYDIKKHTTEKGHLSVSVKAEINSAHAYWTNLGLRRRKDGTRVAWEGWVNDIFFGQGRKRVPSMKQIFDRLVYRRSKF